MLRRLPLLLGLVAAAATLLLVGPVAVAVALLRSSSDAQGPTLAAQIFIAALVLVLAAAAGFGIWALARLVQRLLGRRR
jgi:small neutral amino acid transporter SnatA (MarC family)